MKKIIYLFLIIGMMQSCSSEILKDTPMTVEKAILVNSNSGKYKYEIHTTDITQNLAIWSDSLYSIGDTLKLVKQ